MVEVKGKEERMKSLSPSDEFHVKSAQGWLELGNDKEAEVELDQVSTESACHPAALLARWVIAVRRTNWWKALEISETLIRTSPEYSMVWAVRAETLRHVIGPEHAIEFLEPAVNYFPTDGDLRYALACYCCQSGDLKRARRWLVEAFRAIQSDRKKSPNQRCTAIRAIYQRALGDQDLTPLWC